MNIKSRAMFPSRKCVAEGGQVLYEPLLPKTHPLLGPSGRPRPWEQKDLPSPEPWLGVTEPQQASLQPLNSRRSRQSTQHGKGHTEGLGPTGTGVRLSTSPTPNVRHALVGESRRSKSACACVRGQGQGRLRFHTTDSRLPSHHPARSSSCPARGGPQPSPRRTLARPGSSVCPGTSRWSYLTTVAAGRGTRRLFFFFFLG